LQGRPYGDKSTLCTTRVVYRRQHRPRGPFSNLVKFLRSAVRTYFKEKHENLRKILTFLCRRPCIEMPTLCVARCIGASADCGRSLEFTRARKVGVDALFNPKRPRFDEDTVRPLKIETASRKVLTCRPQDSVRESLRLISARREAREDGKVL
jgi:hypothetical protein